MATIGRANRTMERVNQMNRNKLKTYAPLARRDFIKAVTDRAGHYGLTADKIEPVKEEGDVAIIAGKPFPRRVASMRKKLEKRVERQGFEQVMEAIGRAQFVVVPSLCYETFGRVIVESFARGTPVLVANHGGMAEIVAHDQTGLLFTPGDREDLLAQLRVAAGSAQSCRRWGRAAREVFESRYSAAEVAAKMETVYRSVSGRPGS